MFRRMRAKSFRRILSAILKVSDRELFILTFESVDEAL